MSERVFEPIPGGWRFDLPDLQTSFDAVHLRHKRGDIFAEVTVRTNWPTVRTIAGVIYQATTNLSKATNRKMFADALVDRDAPGQPLAEQLDWRGFVEEFCHRVLTVAGDETLSASPVDEDAAERVVSRFDTAAAVTRSIPVRPPFACAPYLVRGAVTECVGHVKVGKTDLALGLVAALVTGGDFLGQPAERMPVVFLTEQGGPSLRASLARAGLADATNLHVLCWSAVAGERWPAVVEGARRCALRVGAGALFVDTLSRWAGIDGEGENSSGAADATMAPLLVAASDELAVWINRHERKSGGEVGDAGRGSSAFSGAVDIALVLRRGEGNSRPTIRRIHALSRFDDTPETLVVERTDGGYISLGNVQAVAREDARRAVREVLRRDDGAGMTIVDVMEAESVKGFARSTVQVAGPQ